MQPPMVEMAKYDRLRCLQNSGSSCCTRRKPRESEALVPICLQVNMRLTGRKSPDWIKLVGRCSQHKTLEENHRVV